MTGGMRWLLSAFVCLLAGEAIAASACPVPEAVAARLAGRPALLVEEGGSWSELRASRKVRLSSGRKRFAYLFPSADSGAMAIKFANMRTKDDYRATRVRIIRPGFAECGIVPFIRALLPISSDFSGFGTTVDVADYIRFHMAPRDQPPVLIGFHRNYPGPGRSCRRTDDVSSGNRQQFLFEDRFIDAKVVLRDMRLVRRAIADGKFDPDDRVDAALQKYTRYAHIETQMRQYEGGTPSCIHFVVAGQPGARSRLWLNDLDLREASGRRPHVEPSWTIDWLPEAQ
ncbi:hypothetical protein KHC23_14495 [Ancylobacter dichloromethanicus]|uniref:Uncharacterized protein n=1 Tax=Ancylobacter dichloromethanicus TaxID=518825 RepID=A0A9W6JBA9_9HYPH|nr:hypothetical protein [Ancylobacter dichloromethanicus]MBS7554858.1 hypothetical protein [Ancylobacter dichloromethanicus]GLK73251.1 hypothetical protein GCM10017643_33680 [Ancylobacter dichloromethanicus]